MFWNKKEEDKGLPDLPNTPMPPMNWSDPSGRSLSDMDDFGDLGDLGNKGEIHSLPSFPDSAMDKGFSQSAIRNAITDEGEDLPSLPEYGNEDTGFLPEEGPKSFEPSDNNWDAPGNSFPAMRDDGEIKEEVIRPPEPEPEPVQRDIPNKPIFVKVDKFKSARESLDSVREKIDEIDELLKTIRDVKRKEDSELEAWEKEMESVKQRISHVTSSLFDNFYT